MSRRQPIPAWTKRREARSPASFPAAACAGRRPTRPRSGKLPMRQRRRRRTTKCPRDPRQDRDGDRSRRLEPLSPALPGAAPRRAPGLGLAGLRDAVGATAVLIAASAVSRAAGTVMADPTLGDTELVNFVYRIAPTSTSGWKRRRTESMPSRRSLPIKRMRWQPGRRPGQAGSEIPVRLEALETVVEQRGDAAFDAVEAGLKAGRSAGRRGPGTPTGMPSGWRRPTAEALDCEAGLLDGDLKAVQDRAGPG